MVADRLCALRSEIHVQPYGLGSKFVNFCIIIYRQSDHDGEN